MSDELKIQKQPKVAGGIPAIWHTTKKSFAEMGPFKSVATLSKMNQKGGFDCPGCAWPDPENHRSVTEFCENGAKALADEATTKLIGQGFFRKNSITELKKKSIQWLNAQGRIEQPLYKKPESDKYEPIDWADAFRKIAQKIKSVEDPKRNAFYTSGRTSNEAAFLYQLLVRFLGSNNLPDCSNLCHESSGKGLGQTIGIGKGTVTLDELENSDLVIILGQNPGSNHPRMLSSLQEVKKRGGKIITINPLNETGTQRFAHPQKPWQSLSGGTKLNDLHLPVRINGDVALLQYFSSRLLQRSKTGDSNAVNQSFIESKTKGFDSFVKHLDGVDIDGLADLCGVDSRKLDSAVEMILNSKRLVICWAMGATQHRNAVDNIREIVNLLLLRGNFGKNRGGVCPVRGHSNVQGDRTMGIWELPSEKFLNNLESGLELKHQTFSREPGFSVVEMVDAANRGEVDFFMSMGGNIVDAMSDRDLTIEAMQSIPFAVHAVTKLNSSHLFTGEEAIILPVLGRSEKDVRFGVEQFVSVENSMGFVHKSQGRNDPNSKFWKSEVEIVTCLAEAIWPARKSFWRPFTENNSNIRNLIARSIEGFDDYNARVDEGFYLPNSIRDKGEFSTPDGLGHFSICTAPDWQLSEDEFLMMTIRSHNQFNTTVYNSNDRYRGVFGGRTVILMNQDDLDSKGLEQGDLVSIESHYQGKKRRVEKFHAIPYELPKRCVATYFPETNGLIPLEEHSPESKTPASKSIVVQIEKM